MIYTSTSIYYFLIYLFWYAVTILLFASLITEEIAKDKKGKDTTGPLSSHVYIQSFVMMN